MLVSFRDDNIGITLYGGGRLPGHTHGQCPNFEALHSGKSAWGQEINIAAAYEAQGAYTKGLIDIEELGYIEKVCLGSSGSCDGMFTASSMAAAFEAMGMALPNSASHPAVK